MIPGDASGSKKQKLINLTIAGVVSQVGCVTLVIILGALFLGLFLDQHTGSRPWFTIGLVLGSIPISLLVMVIISLAAVKKIKPDKSTLIQQEEKTLGK
jgi:F0F1-type ATP synthase assembly protein I